MNSEKREIQVKDALDFLKKEGLAEVINNFFASEDFRKLVAENYEALLKKVEEIQRNVPETLKKEAKEYWEKNQYTENVYQTDIKDSLIVYIYATCLYTKNLLKEYYSTKGMLNIIAENLLIEANNISNEVKEVCLEAYFGWIYSNYIPPDVPKEVVDFLRMMGGGMIIPVTAIFPEFEIEE